MNSRRPPGVLQHPEPASTRLAFANILFMQQVRGNGAKQHPGSFSVNLSVCVLTETIDSIDL